MIITFLGTSSMVPTKERNHSSIFIKFHREGILFDCGEATQRQMRLANIKPGKITKILISHWHGDHVLGLPGLFQTLNNSEYEGTLEIYGPSNIKKYLEYMFKAFEFNIEFDMKVIEIKHEKIIDSEKFNIFAYKLKHSIETYGFSLVEKDKRRIKLGYVKKIGIPEGPLLGKLQDNKTIEWKEKKIKPEDATYVVNGRKVSIIWDTVLCNNCNILAKDADILISEAVYESSLEEKAREYLHLTAKQAALVASRNNTKRLILTHFSQRYKTTQEICEEAKTYFENTTCAYDLMKVKV